ncbi:hypothetical protein [Microbulbifer litoralis]|uniref:hypothetical protein n=1 Tax=Microbulbifer litoralis TaxID=2933965 RepID=UPI0020294191|nr:hypothetical protein [Microbulbifer sp. GX H0434]
MKNGILKFGDDFVVSKKFTVNDLKKLEKKYSVVQLTANGNYKSYKITPIKFLGKNIIAILNFEGDAIRRVNIYLISKDASWSTETEIFEKRKKSAQDAWLSSLLNAPPPYSFDWGRIESNYDQRSCSSTITVTFEDA